MIHRRICERKTDKPVKLLFFLLACLLLTYCSEDSESNDISYSDAGNITDAQEVVANVEGVSSDSINDDFEVLDPVTAATAATSMALESDEVYAVIDSSATPPPPVRAKSVGNECVRKDIKVDTIRLNYDQCKHASGNISMSRQAIGKWLIHFEDDFHIFGIKINGFILLSRKDKGLFSFLSVDSNAQKGGEEPLLAEWNGRNIFLKRNITIRGEIRSVESPASLFEITGEGLILRSDDSAFKMNHLIGQLFGESGIKPLLFPRPLDCRCPHSGILSLNGRLSAKVRTNLSFEVAKQVYNLIVDLGDFSSDAVVGLKFNINTENRIEETVVKATSPIESGGKSYTDSFPVPKENILKALSESAHPQSVKDAISSYISKKQISVGNIGEVFANSVRDSFVKTYSKDLCVLE